MIKLSDFIAKYLKEKYGVDCVFMVSGGGAMHLNDSFGRYIPYVCNHHEQACAIAAEGYARVNQKLAVVNITTGPGGLNCLNGVFGQWTDSAPVLYISGQVKKATMMSSCPDIPLRQLGDQEVDIISIVKPLTKYAITIKEPNEIKYHLDKAIYLATNGRFGPVWLDIPIDIQASMINEKELKEYDFKEDKFELPNIKNEISKLQELINSSKRPLLIAGHGIRLSNAIKDFKELTKTFDIPIVTTMNGFDTVPYNHKNFIARIGTVANRAGNFALQNADLVICFGTRNNIRQISYNWENFAKNAKIVCVDIDKAELDKPTIKPDLKINADIKEFIKEFKNNIKIKSDYKQWNDFCKNLKNKYTPLTEAERIGNNPIEPYYFINTLIEEFSKDEVVVCGNGSAFLLPFQVGKVKEGQRFIWNSGNASMGYDVPSSIGACIANNKKSTVCLAGDGSIMMNIQELETIKHNNLPIKIFVLNNGGYLSIQQTQDKFFKGRKTACSIDSGVSVPDFVKIADAFKIKSTKINSLKNLKEKIKEVLDAKEPVLCEVMLSPDYIFAPKLSAKTLSDGSMVSPSLEDMYPFLDREEFEENFIK